MRRFIISFLVLSFTVPAFASPQESQLNREQVIKILCAGEIHNVVEAQTAQEQCSAADLNANYIKAQNLKTEIERWEAQIPKEVNSDTETVLKVTSTVASVVKIVAGMGTTLTAYGSVVGAYEYIQLQMNARLKGIPVGHENRNMGKGTLAMIGALAVTAAITYGAAYEQEAATTSIAVSKENVKKLQDTLNAVKTELSSREKVIQLLIQSKT